MQALFKELLLEQKTLINRYFDLLDINQTAAFFQGILSCKGTIFFSGVGKSGLIAQKIVATFLSIGAHARFLSPLDALHGDLGIVKESDLVIFLSKSGESEELLSLLPFVEQRGATTAALVSRKGSRLEKKCRFSLILPVEKELCPHDLTPTISASVQLLFGDLIAIAWMREKAIDICQFAANHPGGLIGRKITLKVADLMLKESLIPICKKEDVLIDVLHELSSKQCGCLLVVGSDKRLEGIFTDGDLRRSIESLGSKALEERVGNLMTQGARTIGAKVLAFDALKKMEKENQNQPVTVLPVVEEGKLVGLIRMHDILQAGLR